MSQLLQAKSGSNLYLDLFFSGKKSSFETNVSEATCYVCGKGLPDGHCITAKTLTSGIVLFCNVHYPLQ